MKLIQIEEVGGKEILFNGTEKEIRKFIKDNFNKLWVNKYGNESHDREYMEEEDFKSLTDYKKSLRKELAKGKLKDIATELSCDGLYQLVIEE